ncbi:MAG: 30S ribosomal protein S16 [Mycoplasmoidaceae bacterium]
MVKIRLTRMGRNKLPYYRIIVADSRNRRDGSYIELLGHYEPFSGKIDLKKDAIIKWLNSGAQPTETILAILKKEGIWKEYQATKKSNSKKSTKKRKLSASRKLKKIEKQLPAKKTKKVAAQPIEQVTPVQATLEEVPVAETETSSEEKTE